MQSSSGDSSQNYDQEDWANAYCNVDHELSNIQLKLVTGEVPTELKGVFYRNGLGQLERDGYWVHHPFDGDGMITAMTFKDKKVFLTNRFVRTNAWEEEEEAGKFIYRGVFGTQKKGGAIANFLDLRLKNIANTNVVKLGDQLLALWEASTPYALNPESLETYGISLLNGVLKPNEAFSAHPRFDPGHHGAPRMVTFGVNTGPTSKIKLMEFASQGADAGKLLSSKQISIKGFAFLHDFAITPNWAVFMQNAIDFNPIPFLLGRKGAAQCLSSTSKRKAKFLLIPRDCGSFSEHEPKEFEAPDGFVFHHLNAHENDNNIILESIFYNSFPSINPNEDFRKVDFKKYPEGILKRCELNILEGSFNITNLSDQCCEFPMVNPNFQGLNARYSWMASTIQKNGNAPLQAIKKMDFVNNQELYWQASSREFVSEPLMVPRQSSLAEDQGWILILIWNGARNASDLIILNSNDLSLQAKLELPIGIPHGLHGSWAPTKEKDGIGMKT